MQSLNSGLSLALRSASQTQNEAPTKGLSFRPIPGASLKLSPHPWGRWQPVRPLCWGFCFLSSPWSSAGAGPEATVPLSVEMASGCPGHWDGEFSLLCPSLQGAHVLPVGSAWCGVPRGRCSTPIPQGSALPLGDGCSPAFSPASRRTPPTERHKEGRERWGVSQEVC